MSAIGQIPDGHHTITPAVVVSGAAGLIDFLIAAFDGKVVDRYDGPDGSVAHAEVRIGDSVLMLGEPMHGWDPQPGAFSIYVADVVATYQKAISLGATSIRAAQVEFYGYLTAMVKDPFGNRWSITRVVEDVSNEEMHRRMAKMMAG